MKQKKPIRNLNQKRHRAYKVSLVFFALYCVVEIIWHVFIHPPSGEMPAPLKAFLFLTPLLIFLPGLVQGSAVKHLLISLFAMFYLARFILNSFEGGTAAYYSIFACLVISGLLVSTAYFARWQGRTNALALQEKAAAQGRDDAKKDNMISENKDAS